jgi:hypothetical protein
MNGITELGYMRIGVASLSRWKEYATRFLASNGATRVSRGAPTCGWIPGITASF